MPVVGNKLVFTKDLMCDVIDNTVSGGRVVRFEYEKGDFHQIIDKIRPFKHLCRHLQPFKHL